MTRAILDESQIHPAARPLIGSKHTDIVREVQAAIAAHQVVVVGMATIPSPARRARSSTCWARRTRICSMAAT